MKISVVIAVYNSHEAVKRQIKYFEKLDLKDVELILVDDYSNPPISGSAEGLKILRTSSKLAWTQGLARNLGASEASGEYLFMTDMDHIIDKKAFDNVLEFDGPFMRFNRYFGILDEEGNLLNDKDSLKKYGLSPKYLRGTMMATGVHQNTFAIKKDIFNEIGGYQEEWCNYGFHPVTGIGDDVYFGSAVGKYLNNIGIQQELRERVYVFPNGRFHKDKDLNPFGLFHDLAQQKQEKFMKGEYD